MSLLMMIAFALAQWLLSAKYRKLRWIPLCMLLIGFAACTWIYFVGAGSSSASVIAENRYFAKFMAENMIWGVVGCALGHSVARWMK